jgi:hypothetical protein
MPFSFLSWNVEHFRANPDLAARAVRIAAHIRAQDPDVFGLFEVETVDVLQLMQSEFPDYTFGITDGPETQEILVGWRNGVFDQASFTQKREFDAHNEHLRPGALLSLRNGTVYYNLLYLHTDSGPDAAAFGNRFEMFDRVWKLRLALNKKVQNSGGMITAAHLIVLGDLNTMGLFYPTNTLANALVKAPREIEVLGIQAAKVGMQVLTKDEPLTYNSGGSLKGNLDHVLADIALPIVPMATGAQVAVRGWPQLTGNARKDFIASISDHASLFGRVG